MVLEKAMTLAGMKKMKRDGTPIAVITAYDYPSAKLAEQAGVDVILVGDSLGNVVLGYDSTVPVTLEDMLHHTKAVTRAVSKVFVVADMPFLTYHISLEQTLRNAGRLMQEGFAKAVKMEGGAEIALSVAACANAGIPVMGHLGFTPQSVHQIGGFFVQGRTSAAADKMVEDALALEKAGAFSIVLELVPEWLARKISREVSIPTIGIGAGRGCDGQVLVFHDLLQYGEENRRKFVKTYANVGEHIRRGIGEYIKEVKERRFPDESHAFDVEKEAAQGLYGSSGEQG